MIGGLALFHCQEWQAPIRKVRMVEQHLSDRSHRAFRRVRGEAAPSLVWQHDWSLQPVRGFSGGIAREAEAGTVVRGGAS